MFTHTLTVRFRDLDLFGHVNNAVYLTYLEEARIALMAATGMRKWQDQTRSTILAHVSIDYRAPAKLGDVLTIQVRVNKLGNTSFGLAYEVLRGETRIAQATSVQVCFNFVANTPIPIPDEWRSALQEAHL